MKRYWKMGFHRLCPRHSSGCMRSDGSASYRVQRRLDKNHAAVVDTGSIFHFDPLIISSAMERRFDFGELDWNVYKTSAEESAPVLSLTRVLGQRKAPTIHQGRFAPRRPL